MQKISVYIADNQPLTRIGIAIIIQRFFNQNAEITTILNKDELQINLSKSLPQVLIIDFDLLDFKNIDEFIGIRNKYPEMAIVVITDNQAPADIIKIVNAGLTVFLLKTCTEQEFIDGVNAAISNKKFFSSEILDVLFDQRSKPKTISELGKLTLSEIEIVRLIAQGLTTKEIALQKHLSFHTIITHRKNIFRKLAISNQSELVMYALRAGIIDTMDYYI